LELKCRKYHSRSEGSLRGQSILRSTALERRGNPGDLGDRPADKIKCFAWIRVWRSGGSVGRIVRTAVHLYVWTNDPVDLIDRIDTIRYILPYDTI